MPSETLHDELINHLTEAAAMESGVEQLLRGMIERTPDESLRGRLAHHLAETRVQRERLEARLASHDATASSLRDVLASAEASFKGMFDGLRGENAARDARDSYVTEHMEIAAYELLERVAKAAGDEATVAVARLNCSEERDMAAYLDERWDEAARRSLQAAGV